MSWPEKQAITQGIVDMLRLNMGLKAGETLDEARIRELIRDAGFTPGESTRYTEDT